MLLEPTEYVERLRNGDSSIEFIDALSRDKWSLMDTIEFQEFVDERSSVMKVEVEVQKVNEFELR
jgi:hypothetical protein